MWCYQKPGFEALLLTELQRQQQGSQFCDTLLQAGGVSVPAHSCVLSAISPHLSSALSSKPAPPAEQGRLLEFRNLGACALLHVVRLIYSGEMAGEGENERRDAISAAARLGIHGLVEVTKRKGGGGGGGVGRCAEVGVQTEPLKMEENEGREGVWRKDVMDGSTFFWEETLSSGEKEMWVQTEELPTNTASPVQQLVAYETIDMDAFQSLGNEFVPITLACPADENQTIQLFSAASTRVNELTAAEGTSVAVVVPSCKSVPNFPSLSTSGTGDPQSGWANPQSTYRDVTAADELEDECFDQFQGNIPGFISYFLNPDNKKANCRGRARSRQRARVGRSRGAGTGEQRARGAARRARGRGGFTEKVHVQEVGVGKLQKLFLHKWGMRTLRTGQGGGAVGRTFFMKTRDFFKPTRGYQRRRGYGKGRAFGQSGDAPLFNNRRGKNAGGGQVNKVERSNQAGHPVDRTQTSTDQSTPLSFSSLYKEFHNVRSFSASSPSPSHSLLSPATSSTSPVMPLAHTTSGPPVATPSLDDQPEQIERLLEEVMMGLDILPTDNNRVAHLLCSLPASSSTFISSSSASVHNKQQGHIHGAEVPALQQQCEGELTDILENFLQSFEQHVDCCGAREESESSGVSSSEALMSHHTEVNGVVTPITVSSSQTSEADSDHTGTSQSRSQPHEASACCEVLSGHTQETQGKKAKSTRQRRKRKSEFLFSLEKSKGKVKKPKSSDDTNAKSIQSQTQRQLQQIPFVKLERRSLTLLGHSLEHKSSLETKSSSSLVKYSHNDSPRKNKPAACSRKTYPIRSRFGLAHAAGSAAFLEESSPVKPFSETGGRRGKLRKNGQLFSLPVSKGSAAPVRSQSVHFCSTFEKHQERREEDSVAQPREESEATGRGDKRKDRSDDALGSKKICLEQSAQTKNKLTETQQSLTNEELESAADEMMDVGRGREDCETPGNKEAEKDDCQSAAAPTLSQISDVQRYVSQAVRGLGLERTGQCERDDDEDIDVVGGSSPAPETVIINWTESSGGEEEEEDEEVDVDGETADCSPSVIFAAASHVGVTGLVSH